MEGIEILSQRVCDEIDPIAFFVLIVVFGIIVMLIDVLNDISNGLLGIITGVCVGFLVYLLIFHVAFPDEYTVYKVTISESVNITEFYEQCEIIDIDGKIYTIKEKNDDEPGKKSDRCLRYTLNTISKCA